MYIHHASHNPAWGLGLEREEAAAVVEGQAEQ